MTTAASKKRYADRGREEDFSSQEIWQLPLDDEANVSSEDELFSENTHVHQEPSVKIWITDPPNPWTKRRAADIVTEKAGPRGRAKFVTTEREAFELFIDDEVINRIVEATNYRIVQTRSQNDMTHAETCEDEIRCLIGVFVFRGLHHDIKNRTEDLWYDDEVSRNLYRASMSRNRFQFLVRSLSFHQQATIRSEIITDAYAKVRWLLDTFETNARKYYKHTELVTLDETLRNFFAHECDLLLFLPDKPGQMGLFFFTLGDGIDRYFSPVHPKMKPAVSMSKKEASQKTRDLVMDITSDIHGTGRNLTADRGFTAVPTTLALYERNVTYVGTIKKSMSGLPSAAKNFKQRKLLSTEFYWKQDSPLMLASYYPKKNKTVLLLTAHDQPIVDGDAKKKAEAILFYNEQRCGVDIVNRMMKEFRSQPKSGDYRIAVFTFLLDLGAVNAQTILQYNWGEKIKRREFLRSLIHQLTAPWLKQRFTEKHLKQDTVEAIKRCLKQCSPDFVANIPPPVKAPGVKAKCYLCVAELKKLPTGPEKTKKNRNLNKHSWYCPECRLAICTKRIHRVFVIALDRELCKLCAAKVATS